VTADDGRWGQAPLPADAVRFLEGPRPRGSELWMALGEACMVTRGYAASEVKQA